MKKNKHFEYWSPDKKFGMIIEDTQITKIIKACKNSDGHETGGIIVGYYTENLDCAVVTDISFSPSDSRSGRFWFYRGITGLQSWLNRIWKNSEYYLGEWHFHPFASAGLSLTDEKQMKNIAKKKSYNCPEPILLIVGGNPNKDCETRAYVFEKGTPFIELKIETPSD